MSQAQRTDIIPRPVGAMKGARQGINETALSVG